MSDIGLEILIMFILILASGVFAMSEMALVAARKSRLQELADKGNARARRALELASAPDRFLMTMQIGITFFVILAGVFGARTIAERLEAFVSRFGRMQDTIAARLLPRWLTALAETPGSQIETLNRAERLNVVESVEDWLTARQLRNRLVHEYMEKPDAFAEDLMLAREYTGLLLGTFNNLRDFAAHRMGVDDTRLPPQLTLPSKD